MGFKGFSFNKSGTYLTYKYPHCYVGIKGNKNLGAGFGYFSKQGTYAGFGYFSKQGTYAGFGAEYTSKTI